MEARGDGKISDEITGDLLEWPRSKRFDRRQWRYGGVSVSFVLLAFSTAFDVLADKGSEAQPPELRGDQLAGLQEAGMASRFVIMAMFKYGVPQLIIGGNIDAALVGEDSGFDLPVGKAGAEWEGNILMHGLKCL